MRNEENGHRHIPHVCDPVRTALESRGYAFQCAEESGPRFLAFAGRILEASAIVTARFGFQDELVSVIVDISVEQHQSIAKFHETVQLMSRKYGEPHLIEEYEYPYERGDGHVETAISLNKATFMSIWDNVLVAISSNFNLHMNYYGPTWDSFRSKVKLDSAADL